MYIFSRFQRPIPVDLEVLLVFEFKNVFKGYYLQYRSPVSLYEIVPILPSYSSVPLMKKESLDYRHYK